MTHHTDAELLRDIEEHMRKMWDARLLPAVCWPADLAQRLTQAVRRAPAAPVPQGWKSVPTELLERVLDSETVNEMADASDELRAMLAAAPQPPEAAPVRKPLTDEQIEALPVWRHFIGLFPDARLEITRAVERAHGIGKDKA